MSEEHLSSPLLSHTHRGTSRSSSKSSRNRVSVSCRVKHYRNVAQNVLGARKKHYIIMAIVILDVAALLANVFIQLIACEMGKRDEDWVETVSEALELAGLVCSSLFMIELLASLFAFGLDFLKSWFHVFDSVIIVLSFIIDIASRGLAESIGSLIVVLRLWRLAKISEELVLGASERMEVLEAQMKNLESENNHLRTQLGFEPREYGGQE